MTRVAAGRGSPLTFIALLAALSVPFWVAGAVFDLSGALPMGMPPSAFQFVLPVAVASSSSSGRRADAGCDGCCGGRSRYAVRRGPAAGRCPCS